MERKVCVILDANNQGGGGETPRQRLTPPTTIYNQWARAFTDRGPYMQKQHSQLLIVFLQLVISGLISVTLIVVSTVNLQLQGSLSPFLGASSWNCGNVCHGYSSQPSCKLLRLVVSIRHLTRYSSEYYLQPLRRN